MLNIVVRLFLMASGIITGWFLTSDAPNFTFVQSVIAILIGIVFIIVCAVWPAAWLPGRRRTPK